MVLYIYKCIYNVTITVRGYFLVGIGPPICNFGLPATACRVLLLTETRKKRGRPGNEAIYIQLSANKVKIDNYACNSSSLGHTEAVNT